MSDRMGVYTGNIRTLDMVYVAVGAALIAVCSWLSIPTTVPFTLQTFAVFLLLSMLGAKRGTLSVTIYILLGAVGAPVFSGFKGGVGVLLGVTGGYIIGFLLTGLIYGLTVKLAGNKMITEIIGLAAGLIACYALGTVWFIYVYSHNSGSIGVLSALSMCVFPFIIPDTVKMILAIMLARRTRTVIR